MIQIKILDRNGKELSNGDKIRYLSIEPDMQEEHGDNIPFGGFFEHQVGTNIRWEEEVIDAQKQIDDSGFFFMSIGIVQDRNHLCELFDLPHKTDDEEFQECVLDFIEEEIGEKYTLEELIDVLNGFEIIKEEEKINSNVASRRYSAIDLVRFSRLCTDNDFKDKFKALEKYNAEFPELSEKQKKDNILHWMKTDLNANENSMVDQLMQIHNPFGVKKDSGSCLSCQNKDLHDARMNPKHFCTITKEEIDDVNQHWCMDHKPI